MSKRREDTLEVVMGEREAWAVLAETAASEAVNQRDFDAICDAFPALLARVASLEGALREAYPYVRGVRDDHTNHGWRRETATDVLGRIDAVLARLPDAEVSS